MQCRFFHAMASHHRFKRVAGSPVPYGFAGATGTIMNNTPVALSPAEASTSPSSNSGVQRSKEAIFSSFIAHLGRSRADKRVLLVAEGTADHADHLVRRAPWLFVVPAATTPADLESIEAHRARMPPTLRARVEPAILLDHITAAAAEWAALGENAYDAILASHAFNSSDDPTVLFQGSAMALRDGGRLFLWEGLDEARDGPWRGPDLVALSAAYGLEAVACDASISGEQAAMLVFEKVALSSE